MNKMNIHWYFTKKEFLNTYMFFLCFMCILLILCEILFPIPSTWQNKNLLIFDYFFGAFLTACISLAFFMNHLSIVRCYYDRSYLLHYLFIFTCLWDFTWLWDSWNKNLCTSHLCISSAQPRAEYKYRVQWMVLNTWIKVWLQRWESISYYFAIFQDGVHSHDNKRHINEKKSFWVSWW